MNWRDFKKLIEQIKNTSPCFWDKEEERIWLKMFNGDKDLACFMRGLYERPEWAESVIRFKCHPGNKNLKSCKKLKKKNKVKK